MATTGSTSTPRAERDLDLVVFGATSFVGRILCRHLVERHGTDGPLRWAIAGRSVSRLAEVAADTGAEVEAIVVDADDAAGLAAVADRTRVIASTVGPYARHGSPLVAAVAGAGTDYLDLTGEPQWIRRMIDAHAATAEASGARIVHCCGFDSIPSDLGVWFLQQRAVEVLGAPCPDVLTTVRHLKGGVSGGTAASMLQLMDEAATDPEVRRLVADPYALNPVDLRHGPDQDATVRPTRDPSDGRWQAPFVMAAVNTKVVHRTHALLGRPWGPDFRYREVTDTGAGPLGAVRAAALAGGLAAGQGIAALRPGRALLRRVVPSPGSGPSPALQEAGHFTLEVRGRAADGRELTARVIGDRDPGYGGTAKMLGEAAVLLVDLPHDDHPGGSWTPASLFGERLVERLEAHAGLRFDLLDP